MPTLRKENNPTPMVLLVLLMCLGIFTPPIIQADIYSWIDADGVKHFTNKPPPGEVAAIRHSAETPYDAEADRINQATEERGFEQRALESALRRLAETERALAESQYRAQEAERRTEDLAQAYDYDDDYPYDWDSSYGGGGYDDYDRRDRETDNRRERRHRGRRAKNRDDRPDDGDHIASPRPERDRRHDRVRRRPSKRERGVESGLTRVVRAVPSPYYMGYRPVYSQDDASYNSRRKGRHGRLSKRERGAASGLTRVVRAVPSPYYMGYRPVYSRDASYESRRGSGNNGRRASRRGAGGSRRSGGRARVSF